MSPDSCPPCRFCGQEHRIIHLDPGDKAMCVRCDSVVLRGRRTAPHTALISSLTGLALALPVILLPFVSAGIAGNEPISLFGGAELKDTSLESLVTGGIAFATPDSVPLAPAAPNETHFSLAAEASKDWQKWFPKIPIQSAEAVVESRSKQGMLNELIKH